MLVWLSIGGSLVGLNLIALGLCRAASEGDEIERAAAEELVSRREQANAQHRPETAA